MAMNLNIDQLIGILQKVKDEVGGDTIVKLYSGSDFYNIPDDESDWDDVTGVEVRGTKSYYGNFKSGEETKQLFIKYE